MLSRRFLIPLLYITLLAVISSAHAGREEGLAAYKRGDYETAYRELLPLAEQGDVKAQLSLGLMYHDGQGVPQDYAQAVKWYRKAAEQGDDLAQFQLGVMYSKGEGVPQDYGEAVKWYRKAAEQGNVLIQDMVGWKYVEGKDVPQNYTEAAKWFRKAAEQGDIRAQTILGAMYGEGQGVPQDYREAVKWYRKAAEQGSVVAENELGRMYNLGRGVSQDYAEAAKWYHKAAEQNNADAQGMLGLMYWNGQGEPQDFVQAYFWFNLAAARGDTRAAHFRDELASQMTPTQIAEAQRMASEWRPKPQGVDSESTAIVGKEGPTQKAFMMFASGSGFVVSTEGHILTNNHVIAECREVRIAPSTEAIPIIGSDATNDLALLKAPSAMKPAVFREGRPLRQGETVTVVGYPLHGLLAAGPSVTTGTTSALAGPGNDTRLIQVSAPVQPGNSGGPLLDISGNVVGVVVGKLDAIKVAQAIGDIPQNVNFAINAAVARNFLDANSVHYETEKSDNQLPTADIAEHARKYTVLIECWK